MKLCAAVKYNKGTTKHYIGSTIFNQHDLVHGSEVVTAVVRLEIKIDGGSIYLDGFGANDEWLWDLWFDSEEAVEQYTYNEFGIDPAEWVSCT